jgi:hypothetical protein
VHTSPIFGVFALPILLLVCSVGPGFALVRRLRWAPLETLCASLALSLFVLYVTSFLIFGLHLPESCYFMVSAGCLAITVASGRDLLHLSRDPEVRRACTGYITLFLSGLIALSLVRHYSGGVCAFDWLEHYERSLYFLRVPMQYKFLTAIPFNRVSSRPPLMNLVAAHFLAQAGHSFPIFQVVFLFLNLLPFIPLCLVTQAFAGSKNFSLALLTGLLLANPMFWWNETWTWTKELTCFYVIFGLWLYLTGWRERDFVRLTGAFLAVSAGFLVHFSAGPYALFLVLHYSLNVFWRDRNRWRHAALIGALCSALLSTWFLPSVIKYGIHDTFGSNTTATSFGKSSIVHNARKIAYNVVSTTIPHPFLLTARQLDFFISQPSRLGYVRDYAMSIYLGNAVFCMGSLGGLLILYLLFRAARGDSGGAYSFRIFWITFVLFTAFVGIAVHPTSQALGVWNICGQPLMLLGIAFLAARYDTLVLPLRWLGLLGCGIDFVIGVFLQFVLENRAAGQSLSRWAAENVADKMSSNVTYLGDYVDKIAALFAALLVLGFSAVLFRMTSDVDGKPMKIAFLKNVG